MSAVLASPAAKESDMGSVRALQHALYRAAKADPGRRFHALWDKILRRDVLERAWEDVRRNGGAAGIDRVTITDVEEYGVSPLLDEVAAALREGRWRPLPARRVFHSQARVVGAEAALDSCCRGPGCAGCGKDRALTDLRDGALIREANRGLLILRSQVERHAFVTLPAAYHANPAGFGRRPHPPTMPPTQAWINQPEAQPQMN